jgi:hypothetical protein
MVYKLEVSIRNEAIALEFADELAAKDALAVKFAELSAREGVLLVDLVQEISSVSLSRISPLGKPDDNAVLKSIIVPRDYLPSLRSFTLLNEVLPLSSLHVHSPSPPPCNPNRNSLSRTSRPSPSSARTSFSPPPAFSK